MIKLLCCFTRNDSDDFSVQSQSSTKNHFNLNGNEIGKEKVDINDGDKLELLVQDWVKLSVFLIFNTNLFN
jgi:hypothetical protein